MKLTGGIKVRSFFKRSSSSRLRKLKVKFGYVIVSIIYLQLSTNYNRQVSFRFSSMTITQYDMLIIIAIKSKLVTPG